jgi:hypothetical protein
MSGTGMNFVGSGSGGSGLSVPLVRILQDGSGAGQHDKIQVGWMGKPEFNMHKDNLPFVALWRYKRGFSSGVSHPMHSGYPYDNTRGWVHPSSFDGGVGVSRKRGGGGAHTTRNGAGIRPRPSEWDVTKSEFYDAIFEPELWFLNRDAKPYNWPIQTIASGTAQEFMNVGQSGQSKNNTWASPNESYPMFCGSSATMGVQEQYFAFSFGINDPSDSGYQIYGPMTQAFKAFIWPSVKVKYDKQIFADRGRKIKILAK